MRACTVLPVSALLDEFSRPHWVAPVHIDDHLHWISVCLTCDHHIWHTLRWPGESECFYAHRLPWVVCTYTYWHRTLPLAIWPADFRYYSKTGSDTSTYFYTKIRLSFFYFGDLPLYKFHYLIDDIVKKRSEKGPISLSVWEGLSNAESFLRW